MSNFQSVVVQGFVGKDPEVRYLPDGTPVANFSVAVTEKFKTDQGVQEHTEWFRVNMFGKIVENLVKPYVKKGSNVTVQGTLRTRKWTDKDKQERSTTELRADVLRLGPSANGNNRRDDGNDSKPSAQPHRNEPVPAGAHDDHDTPMDDDIPF